MVVFINNYKIPTSLDQCRNSFIKAESYFCQKDCPCGAFKYKLYPIYDKLTIKNGGPIRLQQCSNYDKDFNEYNTLIKDLKELEEKASCAGICEKSNIYLFSNVNKEIVIQNCIFNLNNYSLKYGLLAGVIAIFFTLLSLCVFITFSYNYYYKKKLKRLKEENLISGRNDEVDILKNALLKNKDIDIDL